MNTLIQEIIANDLAAREKVKAVEAQKANVKKDVEAKHDMIIQAKQQEMKDRLERLKAKHAEELLQAKQQKALAYEAASLKLKEEFTKKEDEWIKELVACCIHR